MKKLHRQSFVFWFCCSSRISLCKMAFWFIPTNIGLDTSICSINERDTNCIAGPICICIKQTLLSQLHVLCLTVKRAYSCRFKRFVQELRSSTTTIRIGLSFGIANGIHVKRLLPVLSLSPCYLSLSSDFDEGEAFSILFLFAIAFSGCQIGISLWCSFNNVAIAFFHVAFDFEKCFCLLCVVNYQNYSRSYSCCNEIGGNYIYREPNTHRAFLRGHIIRITILVIHACVRLV